MLLRRAILATSLAVGSLIIHPVSCLAADGKDNDQGLSAGKAIFEDNCSSCHGAHGTEGGVGPSLKDVKSRRSGESLTKWIKNPKSPMPKLYPSTISDKDIKNIVIYLQSL